MEQYTKESGVDMGSQRGARNVVSLLDVSNGQIKIINTISLEKNGGNFVQNAIDNTIERNLEALHHGTKDRKGDKNGMTRLVLNPLGTKALKARKKYLADIVEKNSIHRKLHPISVQSRVQCIKEVVYLLENNLITPTT